MGQRDLDVLSIEMDDRIKRFTADLLGQKILQTVRGAEGPAIQREGEAAIEKGIIPQHVLDELGAKFKILAEEFFVGREFHQRAVAFLSLEDAGVALDLAPLKLDDLRLSLADGLGAVAVGERVDRLLADAVRGRRLWNVRCRRSRRY